MRAPTPSAAAELVVSAKDEFCGADRSASKGAAARRGAARGQDLSRRVHMVDGRPAFRRRSAGASRCADATRRSCRTRWRASMRAGLAARERRRQQLERQLTTFDAGRRLAGIRTRAGRVARPARTAPSGAVSIAPRRSWEASPGGWIRCSPLAVLGTRLRGRLERGPDPCRCVTRPRSRPATPIHVTLVAGRAGLRGPVHR